MRERRRTYELMFIISPLHADDEGVASIVERVRQAVETQNGEVTAVNHSAPWGRRRLAYPIRAYAGGESSRRGFHEGFYVLMNLTLPSTAVPAIERTIKLTEPILRHLVILVEQKPTRTRADGEAEADAAEPLDGGDNEDVTEELDPAEEPELIANEDAG